MSGVTERFRVIIIEKEVIKGINHEERTQNVKLGKSKSMSWVL